MARVLASTNAPVARTRSRLGRLLVNTLKGLGSLLVGVALIEGVVFPRYVGAMPTNLLSMTDRFGFQLGQSSKAGVIPVNYILLAGDSHAEGAGDAFLSAGHTRQPYASAHVIARQLGRDVLSVGQSGSGSVRSALAPLLFAEERRLSPLYAIPLPAEIAYYFYEGNDLADNLRWARVSRRVDFAARAFLPAEIAALIAAEREAEHALVPLTGRFGRAVFPGTIFLARALGLRRGGVFRPLFVAPEPPPAAGTINKAKIGDAIVALPDLLQGPALDLQEMEWANSILTLRKSLEMLRATNGAIPITVTYLPSPLATYDLASAEVSFQRFGEGKADQSRVAPFAPAARVAAQSARMRTAVCEIARDLSLPFVDTTPAMRARARHKLLHGPRDWKHPNLEGYRVIGAVVAEFLRGDRSAGWTCAASAP